MNVITIILAVILAIIALVNIRRIGTFLYGIIIYPWVMLLDNHGSTGNGAGIFGPLIGLFCISLQFFIVGGIITGIVAWKFFH